MGSGSRLWFSTHVQFHVASRGPALRFLDKKKGLYSRGPLLVTAGNVMGIIHRFFFFFKEEEENDES